MQKVNLKVISINNSKLYAVYLNDYRIFGGDPTGFNDQKVVFDGMVRIDNINQALVEYKTQEEEYISALHEAKQIVDHFPVEIKYNGSSKVFDSIKELEDEIRVMTDPRFEKDVI